jgi:hypothetical protein
VRSAQELLTAEDAEYAEKYSGNSALSASSAVRGFWHAPDVRFANGL